jgi:hypothetical protein
MTMTSAREKARRRAAAGAIGDENVIWTHRRLYHYDNAMRSWYWATPADADLLVRMWAEADAMEGEDCAGAVGRGRVYSAWCAATNAHPIGRLPWRVCRRVLRPGSGR